MCLLPCNWAVPPTNATVYFTAPWLWTGHLFLLYRPMECGQERQCAMPDVSGPQQVFASPFVCLLSRGELLLGSCCSLTWTQGRAHRADQSPNCNQVPRPPSRIWNLMQSPSQAWPKSAHSRGPTQKLLAEFLSRRIWQCLKLLCVYTRGRDCNLSPQIHFSLISLGTWLANISQPSLPLDVANVRWSSICHLWAWALKKNGMVPPHSPLLPARYQCVEVLEK